MQYDVYVWYVYVFNLSFHTTCSILLLGLQWFKGDLGASLGITTKAFYLTQHNTLVLASPSHPYFTFSFALVF